MTVADIRLTKAKANEFMSKIDSRIVPIEKEILGLTKNTDITNLFQNKLVSLISVFNVLQNVWEIAQALAEYCDDIQVRDLFLNNDEEVLFNILKDVHVQAAYQAENDEWFENILKEIKMAIIDIRQE